MLRKLIKYEWKGIGKVGGLMLLAILLVTGVGCLMLQMPWMKELYAGGQLSGLGAAVLIVMMVISLIVYILVLVGISYGILIFLGVRFYRTMYTKQGYLTHTLPVTPHKLLLSKVLVSGIWYVLVELGVIVSVIALVASLLTGVMEVSGSSLGIFGREVRYALEALQRGWDSGYMGMVIHFLIYIVVTVLVSPFCVVMMIFGAFTIGQLSEKYKGLMGILAYFGINVIMTVILSVVQMLFTFKMTFRTMKNPAAFMDMNLFGTYDVALIVQVLLAVALYWISWLILRKKLNLE